MLCIGKEGVIVMVKDGEIIDISQYRNTEQMEDWQKEAIDQILIETEPFFNYLEALDVIHLKMNTLEDRIKALEEGRE